MRSFCILESDIDADDELGNCQIDLSSCSDDWSGWLNLQNVAHGMLNARIQKERLIKITKLPINLKNAKVIEQLQLYSTEDVANYSMHSIHCATSKITYVQVWNYNNFISIIENIFERFL